MELPLCNSTSHCLPDTALLFQKKQTGPETLGLSLPYLELGMISCFRTQLALSLANGREPINWVCLVKTN
jgi:hypothetical protein